MRDEPPTAAPVWPESATSDPEPPPRPRDLVRATVATVLVPPTALVAASIMPAWVSLLDDADSWVEALLDAVFFGTFFGALLLAVPFWAVYVVAAVIVTTGTVRRRATARWFAILAGLTGGFAALAVNAADSAGTLALRVTVSALWCATVGWLAVLALPSRRVEPADPASPQQG